MSPSRVLAVAASGWMCGDLEGGLVCDLEQVSQSILWHSRTVLGRVSLTGHWQTAWVQGSWLSWGTERLIEQLGIEEISPFHRHHDCSQSSWSITPTLLGQVTFTNKPSSFQKLNQKRGGHREMTVETCITSSWANHSSSSLSVGEEGAWRVSYSERKKGTKLSHSNPSKRIL